MTEKTLSHKQFFLYNILCISSLLKMNELSLLSQPTLYLLLCDIYRETDSWKVPLAHLCPTLLLRVYICVLLIKRPARDACLCMGVKQILFKFDRFRQ